MNSKQVLEGKKINIIYSMLAHEPPERWQRSSKYACFGYPMCCYYKCEVHEVYHLCGTANGSQLEFEHVVPQQLPLILWSSMHVCYACA